MRPVSYAVQMLFPVRGPPGTGTCTLADLGVTHETVNAGHLLRLWLTLVRMPEQRFPNLAIRWNRRVYGSREDIDLTRVDGTCPLEVAFNLPGRAREASGGGRKTGGLPTQRRRDEN